MKNLSKAILLLSLVSTASATTLNGYEIGPYGFLKASAMYADSALASYNNINLSAPTHAVAQTRSQDKTSRMSFQTQQSRIGTTLKKDDLLGRFEFDFIDFTKSSPTTQMVPRVRIASVTYKWDNNKVIIGQDWDLFSPVTTYTFDYVGLYFLAGNSGFMRQQAQYLRTFGEWEFGAALGMAGNNPGVSDNDLEVGKSPSYALRLTRALSDGRIGVSAIYSTLHFDTTATTPSKSQDTYGYNAFYENKYGALAIKSEAYYGQNLGNIGALTIGRGVVDHNVREYGATLTGTYGFKENQSVFGGMGIAKIDNRSEVTPFALSGNSVDSTKPGVRSNWVSRVGYEYKVTPDFSWLSEISRYDTMSKIADDKYQLNIAYSIESGVQFRF